MKQRNKIANFWMRILVRLVDFLIVFVLSSAFLPLILVQKNGSWIFRNPFLFYVWIIYTIFLFCLFFIFAPLVWKGKTLASWIFRTKIIVLKGSFVKAIIKREIVGAWGFVFIMLSFGIILNHTMIIKIIDPKEISNLNTFETFRLSLATTLSGFVILSQMIVAISSLIRKDKRSLNDLYANTKFVYINKFVEVKTSKKNQRIIPKFVKDKPIEWIK